ncbi:hydroxyacid dehydrogenase [Streptomyces silvisoli]|uniref:Hydroxyacid dehydrogenase n=1 Tax=Streptomyces silvisoli TaxID=3034235 RepID=A0ABT5ZHE2_9ACTN|nr:hydroxyacid dehydrogenase [Streptomyces silvisoli]MDF3289248.1 hydroxyacid dehydrogenase [Streptomyces silvisoli]
MPHRTQDSPPRKPHLPPEGTAGSPRRPHAVLAISRAVREALLDHAALRRLRRVAHVDPELLISSPADFTGPGHTARLATAEVLFTCWGCPPLTARALALMPRLRTVVHAAGSVREHITEACWERGLTVSCAAAANALPVAEYTVAAILFSGKRILEFARAYRAGRTPPDGLVGRADLGNYRRTVGVVGASRVGRRVIELLRPFDLRVLVYDPYLPGEAARRLGAEPVELDELARRSDIVTLHAPALPHTRHLFDRARLALLPDGATLINTARGWLVDTEALTEELVRGRLYAVLDHTEPEVPPAGSPLYELPNVLLTPHVAGSLGNELGRLAHAAIDELERYAAGLPYAQPVTRGILTHSA